MMLVHYHTTARVHAAPDLRHGVGARLEDDEKHAQGPALLLQREPVGQLRARQGLPNWVRHARDRSDALRQLLYLHGERRTRR